MAINQLRADLDTLGISVNAAANMIEVEPRLFRRWAAPKEADHQPAPMAVRLLFRLLVEKGISIEDVQQVWRRCASGPWVPS